MIAEGERQTCVGRIGLITEEIGAMRENLVKRRLAQGGVAAGTMMMEFATTGIARIAAESGAEFAVFDMEHTGWSMETIRMLMATSRAAELVPMVRVPALQYHFIARVLDVGAMGLVVPMVADADQARLIVQCAKYPPAGRRGVAFSVAHDDYQGGDLPAKMRRANEELMIIAQIETAQGVQNVEEIAAVDGIDALWIGQYDLSTSLGIPGQFDRPEYRDATRRIVEACRRSGKVATLGALDIDQLRAGPAQGYRMLVYVLDIWIYQQALSRCFRALRQDPDDTKGS
jgi:2-dehydro-3-deoxyglucarate aldolase/4-hydroxy-2-oxoheptanedioate aldolase